MSGSSASDLSRYQGSSGHAAHLQLEESDTIRALDVDASVKPARTRNYWTVANIRAIKNRKAEEGQERVIESSILVWHGLALSSSERDLRKMLLHLVQNVAIAIQNAEIYREAISQHSIIFHPFFFFFLLFPVVLLQQSPCMLSACRLLNTSM